VRVGEATTTKTGRLHVEVAAVFLNQHVSRDFGGTKKRMFRVVDRHRFINPVLVPVARCNLPTRFAFHQRQPIGRVSINLVGGHEDKNRRGTVLSCGLQKHKSSVGINGKVGVGVAHCPVMRGLSRSVDDQHEFTGVLLKNLFDGSAVPDISIKMLISLTVFLA
jgi:hypothetical protein